MAWVSVAPHDLAANTLIRCGTLRAHVLSWRWWVHRSEFVVDVCYDDSAPSTYRGAFTQVVYRRGENAVAWQEDQRTSAV